MSFDNFLPISLFKHFFKFPGGLFKGLGTCKIQEKTLTFFIRLNIFKLSKKCSFLKFAKKREKCSKLGGGDVCKCIIAWKCVTTRVILVWTFPFFAEIFCCKPFITILKDFMNSTKLVIPLHFISWKKSPNDAVTPQRQSQFTPKMKANEEPRLL